MIVVRPISAFEDNYIWLIHNGKQAIVVDPGDAVPVLDMLIELDLTLKHILITHHHADHIGGVDVLLASFPKALVYAPSNPKYNFKHQVVCENTHLELCDLSFQVINVAGHTQDHIAYYSAPYLFCGDTLFSAGCGRLFEGTALQMMNSLDKLACLPPATQVFCAHEYTLKNIDFALTVDGGNQDLIAYKKSVQTLRKLNQPSLPSSIKTELAINPFLRCSHHDIQRAVSVHDDDALATFSALRTLRNNY